MVNIENSGGIRRITPKDEVCFFGYYDMSPENIDGQKVLFQKAPFGDHMPSITDNLSIEVYSFATKQFKKIGETTAWNFQEGCRLQWINNSECIYNVRTEQGFGSKVYDTNNDNIIRTYDFPIYSISNNKCTFYNFNRSRYSYAHDIEKEETDYSSDGIFIGDLISGKSRLVISLEKLSNDAGSQGQRNWVEHCVLNPSGDKFCFFHRWDNANSGMHTRFCVSDLTGSYEVLLNQGFCSHFGWKNDDIISAWGRLPSKINSVQSNAFLRNTWLYKAMVKVYHSLVKGDSLRQKISNDAYIFFDVRSLNKWKLENSDFVVDGHGTWSKNENYMLTDTYPDHENLRHLMMYNESENKVYELGKFFSYPDIRDTDKYSVIGIRCDLHPKWSYSNKNIYFDSTHEGYRALYMLKVDELFDDVSKV